ncbi:hypothetical protein E8E14_005160 [Neopestalotiopsis sp. 37M]|nr:hypothetical protein E8E14_005160 [Neopestalotiopsis sp. 37M]
MSSSESGTASQEDDVYPSYIPIPIPIPIPIYTMSFSESGSESGTASQEDDTYLSEHGISPSEDEMSLSEDDISLSEDDSATDTCSICLAYEQEGRLRCAGFNVATSAVVHQACPECDAFKVDESQLCDFCIHIRPAHLMTCRGVLDMCGDHEFQIINQRCEIVMGAPFQLKSRQWSCAFCQWCLKVVQADAQQKQSIIDEGRVIRMERSLFTEIGDRSNTNGGWEAYTRILFKAKISHSAGGGDNGESRSTYIFIGHNKEFVGSSDTFEDETLVGSVRNIPLITSVADWAAVSQWISRCEQDHETCVERSPGQLPEHFRLIDVAKKRIIDATKDPPPFFALSYVWGANSENEMALYRDNLDELQKPGSLHNLPRTIADAIHVCERLYQPFLWVDRLCIVQDDKEDKYGQIRSLEAIFSRAELVIIAACGENMQSRLAGVVNESPRGKNQIPTNVFGFTMVNKLQSFDFAMQCKWNERGWTYQEAVLARRKLYFTPAEMWFECAEGLERENQFSTTSYKPHRGNHLTAYGRRDVHSSSDVFEEYGHHVKQYSRRFLTYPSDIYHAFHGIEDAFYPECQIIFGLPESDFNRALLWQSRPVKDMKERQCREQDIILPSWSWASLIGQVEICKLFAKVSGSENIFYGSVCCSICNWATLGGEDQQKLVPIVSVHDQNIWTNLDKLWSENQSFSNHPTHRQFLALAWAKGCIEADVPPDLFQPGLSPGQLQSSSIISAQHLALRWPTIPDFWADVHDRKHHRKDHPQPIGLDKGHILTRTQSSMMNVELRSERHADWTEDIFFIRRADTHSGDDEIVGWISSIAEYKLRGTVSSEGIGRVDFIAMAIGYMPQWEARYLDIETLRKNRFNQNQSVDDLSEDQPGVIVMAVRWTGPVARRIGLGWVTLQGWVDSKPEFRTVILA